MYTAEDRIFEIITREVGSLPENERKNLAATITKEMKLSDVQIMDLSDLAPSQGFNPGETSDEVVEEKKPVITEKALEQTILDLVNSFESESKANNAALISNLFDKFDENEDLYECEMHLAFMNFGSFAAMPWLSKHPEVTNGWDKFYIQHTYTGLLSHFLRRIIEENEGSPCSGDKESFIISMLKKSIATGENISLYRTYEGVESIPKEKWGERAYWSPTSFKDTDDVKEKFKMWYQLTQ